MARTWRGFPIGHLLLAALGFVLAGFIFSVDPNKGSPAKDTLREAQGRVTWWKKNRYGLRFRLEGSTTGFSYPSKSGQLGQVTNAIGQAGEELVRVLYLPSYESPPLPYVTVYEISEGDRTLRSWEEIDQARRFDNHLAPWIAGAFALAGGGLLFTSWRARASSNDEDTAGADT